MSNQLAVIDLNTPSALPAYLQAFQSNIGQNLILGGTSRNRIGLKGNRFRLIVAGQEEAVVEDNYLDVIIVGAAPGVSRIYYAGGFDPTVKQPPTCYSADGVAPAADVHNKQSVTCDSCPMNEKGSKVTDSGGKTRACQFFKRLAIVLPHEPTRVYQLDGKSMSIFGESKAAVNKFSLKEYGQKLKTRGLDASMLVTRLSFDSDSSVPKLLFTPTRYLDENEASAIQDVINGDDVKAVIEISAQTVDLSGETDLPTQEVAPAAQEVPAQAAAIEPVKAAAPTVTRAAAPTVAKPAAATAAATAAPVVTRAAAPVVTRAPAPATQAAAPKVTAPTPAVAPSVAASADDDAALEKLLAELGDD